MPRHNRPDLAQGLRRKYATDPPGAFDTISGEIVPVEIVGILDQQQSAGIRGCAGDTALSAVAAQYATLALQNPVDAGVILEITRCAMGPNGSSAYIRCSLNNALSATITALTQVDASFLEEPHRGYPSGVMRAGTQAGATVWGRSIGAVIQPTAFTYTFNWDPPIKLYPGGQFVMCLTTVNIASPGYIHWNERPLSIDEG